MTTPLPHGSLTVPLPLEQYAQAFDGLFYTHIHRRRLREYLAGLLLPRDHNKTLTAVASDRSNRCRRKATAQQPKEVPSAVLERIASSGYTLPIRQLRNRVGGDVHRAILTVYNDRMCQRIRRRKIPVNSFQVLATWQYVSQILGATREQDSGSAPQSATRDNQKLPVGWSSS
jgi:hypothetical protein